MSRTCQEITEWMNETFPERYACDWDNVGLLAGSRKKEVSTVYLALDATEEVIGAAKAAGADLLITHHPLIFKSLRKVNDEDMISRRIMELLQADISYYATHTSYDIAPGGMADAAAKISGIYREEDGKLLTKPLEVTGTDENGEPVGIGKTGSLKEPMTVRALAVQIKEAFSLPAVILYADDPEKVITKAAMCPGSGKGMAGEAAAAGAEALITGDMGHHDGIDMVEDHMALIDAGHYGLEHIFIREVSEKLKKQFPELKVLEAPIRWPYEVI